MISNSFNGLLFIYRLIVMSFHNAVAHINNSNVASMVSGGAPAAAAANQPGMQQFFTPHYSPSVLTSNTKKVVGSISSELSKETVSNQWTSMAATANAIIKKFNEDTGLLITPLDYNELQNYVINSFDIIQVARKLITIKWYINNGVNTGLIFSDDL